MNTQEAYEQLKSVGVTDSIQTVRRWLRDGKIKATRSEYRKAGFVIDEDDLERFINERTGRDKNIEEMQQEIESLKEQLNRYSQFERYEEHQKRQYDDLKKEFNINVDELSWDDIRELQRQINEGRIKDEHRNKLGLSIDCSDDEVIKEYKKLLKILHPDKGGNAKLFQQFKSEYDEFRKSI